ncbi:MAG: hypothetical protein ACRED8_04055 [Caulobacteraceae bacterium]
MFATAPAPAEPQPDPIAELTLMLEELRAAVIHPWTPLSEAIEREYRARRLGHLGGPEGERLASAVLAESERLFARGEWG